MLKENLQSFLDSYYENRFNSIKDEIDEEKLSNKIINLLKNNLTHVNASRVKIKLDTEKESFYAFYKLKDSFNVEYFYNFLFFNKLKLS